MPARFVQNGEPFRYACRLPRVSRDVVDFCSGHADSFYRLPLEINSIGQGPDGAFTHRGDAAWDIAARRSDYLRANHREEVDTLHAEGLTGPVVDANNNDAGSSWGRTGFDGKEEA